MRGALQVAETGNAAAPGEAFGRGAASEMTLPMAIPNQHAGCGRGRQESPGLVQIRHGYRACWGGLELSVETDGSEWTARVREPAVSRILYQAQRGAATAARTAAAEFALFRMANWERPETLASALKWQEFWQ